MAEDISAAATIAELQQRLSEALTLVETQRLDTEDIVADVQRQAQAQQQQKTGRLLILERLHRDMVEKLEASKREVAKLHAESAAHLRREREAAEVSQRRLEEQQREFIAMQEALLRHLKPGWRGPCAPRNPAAALDAAYQEIQLADAAVASGSHAVPQY